MENENEIVKDSELSSSEAEETKTSETTNEETNNKSTDETASADNGNKSKKKLFIIEAVIAVIAILAVVLIVVLSKKGPAAIDTVSYNMITMEQASASVNSGEMIQLKATGDVYVVNYNDSAFFSSVVAPKQEEIDAVINEGILANFATNKEITDRTDVQNGDIVNVSYVGKMDGVAFEGGTGTNDLLIGSHTFIDTFEEQLIGANVGDSVSVNVTFPEDYGKEDLAGKPATFDVTINKILSDETEIPALTDDIVLQFFSQAGEDIKTVDECYDFVKKYIVKSNIARSFNESAFVTKVDNNTVQEFTDDTMDYYYKLAENYGTDLDSLITSSGSTMEQLQSDIYENSVTSAIYFEIINAVAKDLNISVSDEDITSFVINEGFTTVDEFYDAYGTKNTLKLYVLEDKVMDALLEKVTY